jgi:hypothetical protein
MTTDTDRLRFIETIQRLNNWVARTRLSPSEFIKAGSNRVLFDELIKPVAARRPRRWRHWKDISESEQARIVERIRRRNRGYCSWQQAQLFLAKCSIISGGASGGPSSISIYNRTQHHFSYRVTQFAGFPIQWIKSDHTIEPPTNTPAERLYDLRRAAFNRAIRRYSPRNSNEGAFAPPAFISDLHPDDVELTAESVVVSTGLRKLAALFKEVRQPLSLGPQVEEYPLAASLFLTDAASNVEVYYCALLVTHRSAPPTLERAYLARAFDLAEGSWRISARFKRASNALAAGMKLYGEGVASRIQPASSAEGGVK